MTALPTNPLTTSTPLFIFARFRAREGKDTEVGDILMEQVRSVRHEPGCVNIDVYRSVREPRLHFLYSQWESEAAFNTHAEHDHTNTFIEQIEPLLDHTLEVTRTRRLSAAAAGR